VAGTDDDDLKFFRGKGQRIPSGTGGKENVSRETMPAYYSNILKQKSFIYFYHLAMHLSNHFFPDILK
jgi:hypothetical protein